MTDLRQLHRRLENSFNVAGLQIPLAAVKLYHPRESIPETVAVHEIEDESIMVCEAVRRAAAGQPVLLTVDNIGCVAAAITFGFIDQDRDEPLPGKRVYTEIMRRQSGLGPDFRPPSPKDFTDGTVYACEATGHSEFALFGLDDAGRFKDLEKARGAVEAMVAIQPAAMQAAFFFPSDFDGVEIVPDVIVLSVRPVELTRLIQGYSYVTGQRIEASMGPLRAADSDLIVRPFLSGRINVSSYCLGARLVAGYEGDRMGLGVPWAEFPVLVEGMEASGKGYPFHLYPGADRQSD